MRSARRLLLISAALLAIAAPNVAAATTAGTFGVAPLRAEVEAKPGTTTTQTLSVTNASDRAASFSFSIQDIQGDKQEPAATPVLLPGKFASAVSGYDWLQAPSAVRVDAGETRNVAVKVTVPSDATGGHYAAVIVTGPTKAIGNLTATSRLAVPFLMNAGGTPPPDIVVTDVREVKDGGTRVVYRNTGEVHTRPTGTITRRDPVTGRIIQTDASTSCTTALPGGLGECTFESDSGEARERSSLGPNKGSVELVTEDGHVARGDLPTNWAGSWTGLLLPAVGLGTFALYFWSLRRRRRNDTPAALDGPGDYGF